jgi:VCBS repeat-containing protein
LRVGIEGKKIMADPIDGLQYIASYPDLIRAFGANSAAGVQHWLTNGQAEGRQVDTFNERQYLTNYADLRAAFGNNNQAATAHYINNGFLEGRNDDAPPPPGFDGLQYIASYDDLIAAFGANRAAGEQHYIQSGRDEGRETDTFNEQQYLANYADLRTAFVDNGEAATVHFVLIGQAEGRTDVPIPLAVDDAFGGTGAAITEDAGPVRLNVLLNDSNTAPGARLTVVAVDDADTIGAVDLSQNGGVSYAAAGAFESLGAGATGQDSFSYTVRNSSGEEANASVSLTITGVNDAPQAVADTLTQSEDAGRVELTTLADNDTDVDAGDTNAIISVGGDNVALEDGKVFYDTSVFNNLNNGQTATDTFEYTIADAAGGQSTATVTITIIGADEPIVPITQVATSDLIF